jgi:hypothetical protein
VGNALYRITIKQERGVHYETTEDKRSRFLDGSS